MRQEKIGLYLLRYSLAASYLSAVADRFGLWGAPGTPGVVWGNFESFSDYTASLLVFLPAETIQFFSWSATIIEVVLGIFLITGYKLKLTAIASAGLLASFAFSMCVAYGVKSALDYSVFTACAASFLLAIYSSKQSRA